MTNKVSCAERRIVRSLGFRFPQARSVRHFRTQSNYPAAFGLPDILELLRTTATNCSGDVGVSSMHAAKVARPPWRAQLALTSDKVVDISVVTSVMSLSIGHLCATRTSSSRCAVLNSPVNVSTVLKR